MSNTFRVDALMIILLLLSACGTEKSIALYNAGIDAAERDDYAEAARFFSLSVERRPGDAEARYNLGLALIKLERFAEAEPHLKEAVSLAPMDAAAQELLGESLEKQGKLVEAKAAYRAALNIKPNRVSALLGLASIALAEGQTRSAQAYATEASGFDPNNLTANVLLSEAYFRNGEYNSAYAQILTAKRLKPSDAAVELLAGKIAYHRRMYADALSALASARALGLGSDELYLYLGLTRLALESPVEAERDFRLAIYKNDGNAEAWKGLGETYIVMKRWPDAAEAIEKALALDPANAETALDRALIAMNTGDDARAALDLEEIAGRDGAPRVANYYLGHAYLRLGRSAEARAAFERFIAAWEGDGSMIEEARAIVERLGR